MSFNSSLVLFCSLKIQQIKGDVKTGPISRRTQTATLVHKDYQHLMEGLFRVVPVSPSSSIGPYCRMGHRQYYVTATATPMVSRYQKDYTKQVALPTKGYKNRNLTNLPPIAYSNFRKAVGSTLYKDSYQGSFGQPAETAKPAPYDYPSLDKVGTSTYRDNFRKRKTLQLPLLPSSPTRRNNPHPTTMNNAFPFPNRVPKTGPIMGLFCSRVCSGSVTVNGARYRVIRDLGEGAFSYVHLVKKGKHCYALKRMRLQLREQEEAFANEIAAHRAIDHPNVMSLYDVEIVTKSNYKEARMVLEYYKDGTVQDMIEKTVGSGNPAPESHILKLFRSACQAIAAFHTLFPPLAHRDIKPHNLLLAPNCTLIVFDLGSVTKARCSITSRREALALQEICAQQCTAAYRAPELFEVPSHCEIDEKQTSGPLGVLYTPWHTDYIEHAMKWKVAYAACYVLINPGDSPCDGSALSALSGNIQIPSN
ncbi:hypothetical protein QZH41_015128, partial [Actinostola sp. cb2023]